MAPGIFCVWSSTTPDTLPRSDTDGGEGTFEDAITALPGVTRGLHLKQAEPNMMAPPYNHDIPYLTVYHMSDAKIFLEKKFKEIEEKWQSKKENAFMPRFYEEVVRIVEEGCEDIEPEMGDLIAVWTSEAAEDVPRFEQFHRDGIVGSLREAPNFLRARVYQQIGGMEKNEQVSSPFLFLHEWDSDELPWTGLVKAAMTQEWQDMIEGGLKWQGGCYHIKGMSRKAGDERKRNGGVQVVIQEPEE